MTNQRIKIPRIKIPGIILAAGSSSRMGRTKQVLPFHGKPILSHVIENCLDSDLSNVFAVIGHDAQTIKASIDFSKISLVMNEEYAKGQSSSLKKGLNAISTQCDGAMFLLGDQPLVDADIINILIKEFYKSNAPIIIPFHKGKRGNPVIIARTLFPRLKSLTKDTGARVLFNEYKNKIHRVDIANPAILLDLDTLEDYQKLEK